MHIGHFSNTYIPTISGVVRNLSSLREAHLKMGHQVSVFTQNTPNLHGIESQIYGYPTSKIKMPMGFPIILPYSSEINRRLPFIGIDIIHVHHPFMLGVHGLHKARELGIPTVFTFHTRYWDHSHFFPGNAPIIQKLVKRVIEHRLRRFLRDCDSIVVYTETMRELISRKFAIDNTIHVVPTGIDREPYQIKKNTGLRQQLGWDGTLTMISVGRLSLEKNWETLLRAAYLVTKSHRNFRLVLIGDGPQRKVLERQVREMGISRFVVFLGWVAFNDIPNYLQAADLFGFASVTETIGRVTMEAMAAGLPVVAVKAPGTSDLITDDTEGILVENDSLCLANAIRIMLDREDRRRMYGMAALRKSESFDVKIEAKKLLGVYYNTINMYGGTNRKQNM